MAILFGVLVIWPAALATKLILLLLGIPGVAIKRALGLSMKRGVYQVADGRPDTYWEAAIRNPVGGFDFLIDHPPPYTIEQRGDVKEPGDTHRKFQWRLRWSGVLVSVRFVWKYSSSRYGELYLGWKLLSEPPKLDFASSIRPWAKVGQ